MAGGERDVLSLCERRARRAQADPWLVAAGELLAEVPYRGLTLPAVAARAGTTVADLMAHHPTKDALIAGVYLHRLQALPVEIDADAGVVERLRRQVQAVATLFADSPQLGIACNIALMRNDDPAVMPVRADISAEIRRRIAAALGPGAWPEVHNTLETVICGALLQVGAGMLSYRDMVDHVDTMFALLLPE
ncbi:TetR/AcrR family transcriptional regulator [Mycobacterium sp. MYCO198283]|uniref:TetR/AcrR family transcriptional regulator n=1 Tax=Mycobacterium sp. MYCO198283 TaxID=2883505 RepID=UPI001E28EAB8|nr:TetR/AcrR family transcriptional regulator [Mycobacterium sp. MYCO198283]MCG5434067.1 TetR/AcrR family transcriptional regulator [Mycobacterium sp. MYCO198283]